MAKQGEHGISWTDETINPIRALNRKTDKKGWFCTKVSAGCKNCYSERMNNWRGNGLRFSVDQEPLAEMIFDPKAIEQVLRWKKPKKIFVCDMTDLFHPMVKDDWLEHIFAVMALAEHHTFQLLTKRPERMRDFCDDSTDEGMMRWACIKGRAQNLYSETHDGEDPSLWLAVNAPLKNVWLGVSVEDQATAEERIPILACTSAAVRWVSYEPALGPVDFIKWLFPPKYPDARPELREQYAASWRKLHPAVLNWIVWGGESGPGARPPHPSWATSTRDQCVDAGIPFLMKQWGEWSPLPGLFPHDWKKYRFEDGTEMVRMGKKRAGRLLDLKLWDQFPQARG